jgi:hypothetical protein
MSQEPEELLLARVRAIARAITRATAKRDALVEKRAELFREARLMEPAPSFVKLGEAAGLSDVGVMKIAAKEPAA